ncbi:hypothetical protein ABT214_27965, partial [Micromonospora purpureochromogenes]
MTTPSGASSEDEFWRRPPEQAQPTAPDTDRTTPDTGRSTPGTDGATLGEPTFGLTPAAGPQPSRPATGTTATTNGVAAAGTPAAPTSPSPWAAPTD